MAIDLTPQRMKCDIVSSCPSVHRLEDGRLLIIGKIASHFATAATYTGDESDRLAGDAWRKIAHKIGVGEEAIVISPDYFENVLCQASDVQTGNGESLRDRAVVNEAPDGASPSGLPSLSQGEPGGELKADFLRSLPGGKLDDSSYEKIEDILDKAEIPSQIGAKWLTLVERVKFLADLDEKLVEELRERDRNPQGEDFLGSVEDESPVCEANSPVPSLRSSDERSAEAENRIARLEHALSIISEGAEYGGPWCAAVARSWLHPGPNDKIKAMMADYQKARRPIEEAGLPADERTAEHQSASLTPNIPQEAHSEPRTAEDVSPAVPQPQDG